jgi:hypothetical protein
MHALLRIGLTVFVFGYSRRKALLGGRDANGRRSILTAQPDRICNPRKSIDY